MMGRRALLVLVALMASAYAVSLRVSTFNVLCQACALTDEDYNLWVERLVDFKDLFARQPCDIYGIQELMHRYNVDELLEVLPNTNYEPLFFNQSGLPNYPDAAIFFDRTKMSVLESGQYWLSRNPDRPFSIGWTLSLPRIVSWAVFQHNEGPQFFFLSTHFDNNGDNKIPSATLFLERSQVYDTRGLPVIAVGDYNSRLDTASYALLTTGLGDGFYFANSFDLATNPVFDGPTEPLGFGCPMTNEEAPYPLCLIDHVFLGVGNSPISRYNVTEWVVDTNMYNGKFPSDHRFHAATISFD